MSPQDASTSISPKGADYWDSRAATYGAIDALLSFQELMKAVIQLAGIENTTRVLDAGCGVGLLLRALGRLDLSPPVVGIDLSPDMLALARQEPYGGRAQFYRASVEESLALQGVNGPFDVVASVNVLTYLHEPKRALTNLADATVRGGLLVATLPAIDASMLAVLDEHCQLLGLTPGSDVWSAEQQRIFALFGQEAAANKKIQQLPHPDEAGVRKWFTADTGWHILSLRRTYGSITRNRPDVKHPDGQNWLILAQKVGHGERTTR